MFKRRFQPVLHPVLLVLFPILALYASNLGQTPFSAAARSIFIGSLVALVVLVLLRLVLRDWHRAGLMTSLGVVLVLSYGYAYRPVNGLGLASVMAVIWMAVFLLGVAGLVRLKTPLREATRLLNIVSAIALATCLVRLAPYTVQTAWNSFAPSRPGLAMIPDTADLRMAGLYPVNREETSGPPDIYYIILDGYGRDDVLQELYGLDNSAFLDGLRERGFYVAGSSHSNYGQTSLSLSSSLNMDYLDTLADLPEDSQDRGLMRQLINDNNVMHFLEAQGYESVAFSNAFSVTELTNADVFMMSAPNLNNFEIMLLSQALAGEVTEERLAEAYRDHILSVRDQLDELLETPAASPRFVFIHLILPHPPFVFRADGSLRPTLAGGDGSDFPAPDVIYRQGYREQLQFTNTYAQMLIDSILERSARPPVIVLQGDHGPGSRLDWNSAENTCFHERFSILNAFYLPGQDAASLLYPSISPVNNFRMVLNAYFGADLPQLPDRSFFSLWDTPYKFQEITGQVGAACSP